MAELGDKIMVCIHCMTYNHEKYLADALEGFVMQKTDFPFVAVVIDDCSTDGTANVLREYEAHYPDIIKAVYLQENYYSQHKSKQPFLDPWDSNAKYIAHCEGDDYWTDPLKLQKQVEFMETNANISLCFHKCNTLIQSTGKIHPEELIDMPGESTILDLAKGNYIHTLSVLYRNLPQINMDYLQLPNNLPVGDYTRWIIIAKYGNIYKFPDIMGTYRNGSGMWSTLPRVEVITKFSDVIAALILHFDDKQIIKCLLSQYKENILELGKYAIEGQNISKSKAYRLGKYLLSVFK